MLSGFKRTKNPSGGKALFATLPIEHFGRNLEGYIYVVDDMKIKRLNADQIGPKASTSASAVDGGGIPCVD